MGREIRRVPKDWEHPRDEDGDFIPLFDETYKSVADKWVADCILWSQGKHEGQQNDKDWDGCYFWEYEVDPPDPGSYRPEYKSEPTHYQVYETVSEGTPVSPAFPTEEDLIEYLYLHGDDWAKSRGQRPPSREAATQFVKSGYAPSMTVSGGKISIGIDSCSAKGE